MNYKQLTDEAYSLHSRNKLAEAEEIYKKLLEISPDDANILNLYGLLCVTLSRYDEAVGLLSKAVVLNNSAYVITNLAKAYLSKNDIEKAVKLLERAIEKNPDDDTYYSLAIAYKKQNKLQMAANAYELALKFNSKNYNAAFNLALIYNDLKNYDNLLITLVKCLEIRSESEEIFPLFYNLAKLYRDMYDNSKSIEVLKKLIYFFPDSDAAISLLAINYMDLGEYDKALNLYNKAYLINPDKLNYLHGKSTALKYLGKIQESKNILEYIVNKEPDLIEPCTSLGMMYLQEKDFERGMPLYIKRSEQTNFISFFKDKKWNKNIDLKDKIVLVYTDCGLGDTLMFVRYIFELQKIAKEVIIQTDRELVSLLKNSLSGIKVFAKSEIVLNYDVVIPIMNLPLALNMDFSQIPNREGYLNAQNNHAGLFNTDKLKIGIVREGNKRIFKNRSIPASFVNILTADDRFEFYSFQKDDIGCNGVTSLSKHIKDYSDTASLLSNMDLLITIDSSIVHCAGALGVKTFLLLPFTAEWRWFDDRDTCVWYNSVKIFKQPQNADWQSVINNVLNELDKL